MKTLNEIKSLTGADSASKKNGVITLRREFFYRHGRTVADFEAHVRAALPGAVILDRGEHYAPFNGGASPARSTHWWVKLTLHEVNDSTRPGALATPKSLFGENSRYAVAAVHTRFDHVSWFVWDAEKIDEVTGGPAVILQDDNLSSLLAALEALDPDNLVTVHTK